MEQYNSVHSAVGFEQPLQQLEKCFCERQIKTSGKF